MALQTWTLEGSTNHSYWRYTVVVTEDSASASTNSSTLSAKVYLGRKSSASHMTGASISGTVTIGGTAKSFSYKNTGTVNVGVGQQMLCIGTISSGWTIGHNSTGAKTVAVSSSMSQSGVNPTSGTLSSTNITLTKLTLTSACGAPTSVSASGIITPSGTFTVSWSGASSGTNNTIATYQVYYRIGGTPTTSTYTGTKNVDVTNGTTSGSTTFTVSGATRGATITCGVVTRGTAGASYYSGMKTGGSVTINSLPAAPSLNKSSQTIASTSTGVSVTATAGSDANTSQTRTVYYATSASGSKSKYSSAININPSAGGSSTYYFWTHDGLEYSSSYTSITITKNTKPTVSNAGYNSIGTYTAKGVSTYAYQATPKVTSSKSSGTYYLQWRYKKSTDSAYGSWADVANATFSSTSVTCGNRVLDTLLVGKSVNLDATYDWNVQFQIRVKDSYEYSDWINCGDLTYAGRPSNNTPTTIIYNSASDISITNDSRLDTWSISSNIGTASITSTTTSGVNRTFVIGITGIGNYSGDTVTFTLTGTRTNPTVTKTVTFTKILRTKTSITNFTIGNKAFSPFTETDSGELGLEGVWGNDFDEGAAPVFTIGAEKSLFKDTGKTFETSFSGFGTEFIFTGSDRKTIQTNDVLTDFSNNPTSDNLGIISSMYYGNQTFNFIVSTTNKYGETISASCPASFYFDTYTTIADIEDPEGNKIQYTWTDDGETGDTHTWSSWENFGSSTNNYSIRNVQQGMGLRFQYKLTNYCYGDIVIKLQMSTNNVVWVDKAQKTYSQDAQYVYGDDGFGNVGPVVWEDYINYGTSSYAMIGEISDNSPRYWRLVCEQTINGSTVPTTFTYPQILPMPATNVIQSEIPQVVNFVGGELTTSNKYKISFAISKGLGLTASTGSDTNVVASLIRQINLQYQDPDTGTWYFLDNASEIIDPTSLTDDGSLSKGVVTFNGVYDKFTKTMNFRFQLVTKVDFEDINSPQPLANEKSVFSTTFLLYLEEPTVAYRRNQLGINTREFDDDSVLEIATSADPDDLSIPEKRKIVLKGVSTELIITFGDGDGTNANPAAALIQYFSRGTLLHEIDLLNGTFN